MGIKLLAVIAVLFLVYLVFFKRNREKNIKDSKKFDEITDTMVECPTCGTFISKDDAILSNGKYFCSKECLNH
ncbi:MAG: PP0621 family protein [Campylobacterota bacterium]|nr:PP0621 family protein [Campylobacterota bacterium]